MRTRILNSNLTSFWAPLRALPFAGLLLLTAASDNCTIIVDDGDSGSEPSDGECPEVPEGCPLTCEVDDNGCTVCECDDIQVGCTDDSECGEGQVCVFAESCGCDGAAPSEGEGEAGDRAAPPCDCDVVGACQDDVVTSCADIVCEPGLECAMIFGVPQCVTATSCESDSDCAEGEYCEIFSTIDPPFCEDGECDWPASMCLPVTNPCFSDADCAEGFVCEFASADPPVCDGEECAAPIAPAGQCVAQTGGDCFSDSDCPAGQLCGFFNAAPCFDCFVAEAGQCYVPTTCEAVDCGEGYVCVDSDFGPSCEVSGAPCVSDADCVESQHCDIGAAQPILCEPSDPACDMLPPPPVGVCVADTNDCWALCGTEDCTIEGDAIYCGEPAGVACQADDACAMDQICNTVDFCLADPSCVDDAECPAVCFGMCVAAPTDIGCAKDADCGEAEFCNLGDCPQDAACFGMCETLVEG